MKKLSILIALIVCVTVSGVYAAWLYPSNNAINQVIQPVSNVMADVEPTGAYGSYHTVSNSLRILVDQKEPTVFETKLVYDGELVIKFTPHERISDEQTAAALGATVTVTGADVTTTKYQDKQIWNVDEAASFNLDPDTWTEEQDGSYTYSIKCEALKDMINLKNVFELPTIDDYNTFQQTQKLAVFRVKVTAKALNG